MEDRVLNESVGIAGDEVVTHENPAWRDRANFIIAARLDSRGAETKLRWEQLWARQLGEDRFEVCCIPFFIRNLSLGDEVETGPAEEKKYVMQRVVQSSGRYAFRVWFHDPKAGEKVFQTLEAFGCLMEWRWPGSDLLAVDASSLELAQRVADFLIDRERKGELEYETGRT